MFAGRHVLVAGAGVTGKSVVPALTGMGARVTVTDELPGRLAELDGLGAELVPGLAEPPSGVDLLVTSPGWRPVAWRATRRPRNPLTSARPTWPPSPSSAMQRSPRGCPACRAWPPPN